MAKTRTQAGRPLRKNHRNIVANQEWIQRKHIRNQGHVNPQTPAKPVDGKLLDVLINDFEE